MKAHLAYLTATRYLFAEKHHTDEGKTTMKKKARMKGLVEFVRHWGGARNALWLLAAMMSGSGDDLHGRPRAD
jgi:hypothetical protein